VNLLKNLTNLVEVNLPGPEDLDDDFNPPYYAIPMDEPGMIELANAQREASVQKILGIVREHLPFLERVALGFGEYYNLTRNDTSMALPGLYQP
jgi:hypothetical protein